MNRHDPDLYGYPGNPGHEGYDGHPAQQTDLGKLLGILVGVVLFGAVALWVAVMASGTPAAIEGCSRAAEAMGGC